MTVLLEIGSWSGGVCGEEEADGSVGRERSRCPALDASRDVRSAMIVQWVSPAGWHNSPAPAWYFSIEEMRY